MRQRHVLHCPSLAYLAAAMLSLACSRQIPLSGTDAIKTVPSNDTTITKEWVGAVGYRPVIGGQVERDTTIDKDASCVQMVKISDGEKTAQAVEFHRAACPTDNSALTDETLAFRTWMIETENADWGSTHKLITINGETTKDVGQVQISKSASGGARLEELCQFTNQTTGTATYGSACTVTEYQQSWGTIDYPTQLTQPTSPNPENQETEEGNTEPELARR